MKVGQNYFPKSSFLSVDKDLANVVKKLMTNQRLMKLLYYTEKDCLKGADLTPAQIAGMLDKQIKIVPYLEIKEDCPNQIIVTFGDFVRNKKNPEFRDNSIDFTVVCHPDHWNLGDFALRPYKIVGEIDAMIDNQKLSGIGTAQFGFCDTVVLNNQHMGLILEYDVIHGIEDKINPLV